MSRASLEEKLDSAIRKGGGELIGTLPTEVYEITPATGTKRTIEKFEIRLYKFPNNDDYRRFYASQNPLVIEITDAPNPETVKEQEDGSATVSLKFKIVEPNDITNTSASSRGCP